MYAIVKTGGKQYRVERGQTLLVERLPAAEGSDIQLEPLLFRSDDAVFDKDGLKGVTVTARILGHVRGEKLRVFKFKPKRGYKRRTGHRQDLTRIEVLEISAGGPSRPKEKAVFAGGPATPKAKAVRAKPAKAAAAAEPKAAAAAEPKAAAGTEPSAEQEV